MRTIPVLLVAALTVAGCAVQADLEPGAATMRLKDGRASGRAGCNAYGAKYHVDPDGKAGFTQSLSTRMACLKPAGAMQVERGVFDAFRQTAKVAIVNGDLLMLDAAGNLLARLAPIGSP
jgi:heat shock protein HslJ